MPASRRMRSSPTRRQGGHQAGQSMAEFAVVLLLLSVLILGIVDFARAVYAQSVVANAAREGARRGSVNALGDATGIEPAARSLVAGLADADSLVVDTSWPDIEHVQVEVSYTFHPVTFLIGQILDDGSGPAIVLRSRSVMRRE